jgi:hypothetical protein
MHKEDEPALAAEVARLKPFLLFDSDGGTAEAVP